MNLTDRRRILLADIGNVTRWLDGDDYHRAMGRKWKVTADIRKFLDAGLIEPDPDDEDLDLRGYRRTAAGDAALNPTAAKEIR